MRDWSDSLLDDFIAYELQSQTVVTPRQKRQAWERLQERVVQESRFPTLAFIAPAPGRWRQLARTARAGLAGLVHAIFDETPYDRALERRRAQWPNCLFDSPMRHLMGGLLV